MTQPDSFYVLAALWSQVVASILFIVVLAWLWVKFIQPAIMAAQERYNKQIAEAERHRDEAKATLDLLKAEVNGASHDADLIKERADAHAQREYDGAVTEAKEAGERALANARGELERARAAAREQLRDELLDKALASARAEAQRRIDAPANARLVDSFVASLERGNG
jgi:F-type H+-transporting ATPase subunit b